MRTSEKCQDGFMQIIMRPSRELNKVSIDCRFSAALAGSYFYQDVNEQAGAMGWNSQPVEKLFHRMFNGVLKG